jgi:hypothetical protein
MNRTNAIEEWNEEEDSTWLVQHTSDILADTDGQVDTNPGIYISEPTTKENRESSKTKFNNPEDNITSSMVAFPKIVSLKAFGHYCNYTKPTSRERIQPTDEKLDIEKLPNLFDNILASAVGKTYISYKKQETPERGGQSTGQFRSYSKAGTLFRVSPTHCLTCKHCVSVKDCVDLSGTVSIDNMEFIITENNISTFVADCPDVVAAFVDIATVQHQPIHGHRFFIPKVIDLDSPQQYDNCEYPLVAVTGRSALPLDSYGTEHWKTKAVLESYYSSLSPYLSFGSLIDDAKERGKKKRRVCTSSEEVPEDEAPFSPCTNPEMKKAISEGLFLMHCATLDKKQSGTACLLTERDWLRTTSTIAHRHNYDKKLTNSQLRTIGMHVGSVSAPNSLQEYEISLGHKTGTKINMQPNLILSCSSLPFATAYASALVETANFVDLKDAYPEDDILDIVAYCEKMKLQYPTEKHRMLNVKLSSIIELCK